MYTRTDLSSCPHLSDMLQGAPLQKLPLSSILSQKSANTSTNELPVSCILWQKIKTLKTHPAPASIGQCHAWWGSPGEIPLDHMFLEEFAVVGFIRLIISLRFAIVESRIVDHVCDVMATAGDQKTMSVITWWQNQWFSSFLWIHRNSRKQELDIYHLNIQPPAIIHSTRPMHLRLYPTELLCTSRYFVF